MTIRRNLKRRGHNVMDKRRKELQPEYYTETAGVEVYITSIIQLYTYRSSSNKSTPFAPILQENADNNDHKVIDHYVLQTQKKSLVLMSCIRTNGRKREKKIREK